MTKITRRAVLAGAALSAAPLPALSSTRRLRAAPGKAQITPPGDPVTDIWGYDAQAPGPELRFRQGDRLAVTLENALPQETTIHWHGLRLPNAMDGVPDLTQPAVAPGADFAYAFDLKDAGTYWYHSHVRGWEQVARGLHGPLIVEEPTPPDVDRDLTLVLDDWRLDEAAQIDDSLGALFDRSHGGRIGNWVTVNGEGAWAAPARRGERLRLRLINAANARIFSVSLKGGAGVVAALDGHPLAKPEPLDKATIAPAQRADLIVDLTAEDEAILISHERDGDYALASFPISGDTPARDTPPPPLAPNEVPPLGPLETARVKRLVMEGGAMGRLGEAQLGEETLPIRQLAQRGMVWAFNGRADRPPEPLVSANLGETVVIEVVNDTRWPHAMHLHGHHFRVLGSAGPGPLRDTTLVQPGARAKLAFVADNPGAWLLHCHMLEHAAAGMSTWIEVA